MLIRNRLQGKPTRGRTCSVAVLAECARDISRKRSLKALLHIEHVCMV